MIFVGITAFLPAARILDDILPSYGEYVGETTMALALFASLVAPESLCTDRRTGMLDLYLAGPLDVKRYLAAKWAAVAGVMLVMTVGPQLFLLVSYSVVNAGPSLGDAPLLLLRIVVSGVGVALFYTAVAMGVSSLTTRRAVAAVATVLVLLVPTRSRSALRSRAAAHPTSSRCSPPAWQRSTRSGCSARPAIRPTAIRAIARVSTGLVVAGLAGWILLGAAVCLASYRRQGARR